KIHHLNQNNHKNHSSDNDLSDSEAKFIILIKIITKIIVQTMILILVETHTKKLGFLRSTQPT
ncbi:hypothetical protein MEO42_11135, partial [Dolichospermum sp. ST_sed6]|nr:hypothetical protein [Dolichospermum sp. ST_sed6]